MPKRQQRSAALKSGYASVPPGRDEAFIDSSNNGSVKKRRVTRSSYSAPSSPDQTHPRHAAPNTIDDARTSKQTTLQDIRLSTSLSSRGSILRLPDDVLFHIISFIACPRRVDEDTFVALQSVCHRFNELANSPAVWNRIPLLLSDGSLNISSMGFIKKKSQGTEGVCFQVRCRRTHRHHALKRARVYPDNEGVPYYMMRELSALKKLNHPNICELEMVSLHNYKLYLLFPYIERTLHDFMNPCGADVGIALSSSQTKHIMRQLLSAVAYCHERCIMHRNLKPKHLLVIPGPGRDPLDGCTVKLADFALVRVLVHPPRNYTTEVITLWYRPPEILLGQRNYSTSVDMWSVGCIFAELMRGRPLFAGVCEIDQLFQIFSKLGTPSDSTWPKFRSLPHFQDSLFPSWQSNIACMKNIGSCAIDLLSKFLLYDPESRIASKDALQHEFFIEGLPSPAVIAADDNCCACSANDAVPSKHIGHRVYAKVQTVPAFSASSNRAVNFDISAFIGLGNLSPMVLRQYMYLRYLEEDDVYKRPYFGRMEIISQPLLHPIPIVGILSSRHVEEMSAGSVTSSNVDDVCLHRMELVDNLIDIMDSISVHMCTRTVFFAVSIFDRYLALCDKPREDLFSEYELIGSTCLHIASKCEDVSYISVKDLALAARNIIDGSAILKMEETVLNKLNFDLYIPAIIDFVGFYLESLPEIMEDSKVSVYARYFSELSLMYPCFLTHPASLVASAIVSYSLLCCGSAPWLPSLEKLSMYDKSSVFLVVKKLNRMHSRVLEIGFHGIFDRYSNGITPYDVALNDAPVLMDQGN